MARKKRKIIKIAEEKCTGCGLCLPACPEGALRIVGGKVRLVKESFCDGLGACLGECPEGALSIEEREAEEFDEAAALENVKKVAGDAQGHAFSPAEKEKICPCPSAQVLQWKGEEGFPGGAGAGSAPAGETGGGRPSQLRQWPVQLHLVPVDAPYFRDADFLLVADCVPFACGDFHGEFLRGRAVAVGCPKLDDAAAYRKKLARIFERSKIKSLTVLRMEVPCCGGLVYLAREALAGSDLKIPARAVTIGIKGEKIAEEDF
ncbi:MAG: ATP-binding protein [Desulfotomaculales bacterium]